jgi:predicted ribosome quality control (RQC) complex YloA/Tae2 family protein
LYRGEPPSDQALAKAPLRFAKLLTGADLVAMQPEPLDRVVRLDWRRSRPSGLRQSFRLIVEWMGTRAAAFLVDEESREILDLFGSGRPRLNVGEVFEPLSPPRGAVALADSQEDFESRFEMVQHDAASDRDGVMASSGLTPLLSDEVCSLRDDEGLTWGEAFEVVRKKLEESAGPVVYCPDGGLRSKKAKFVLSMIPLSRRTEQFESYTSFNRAAEAFIVQAGCFFSAQRRCEKLLALLRKKLKKQRSLSRHLIRERDGLDEPGELRRRGELLLAGLNDALRMGDSVEVPNPYDPEGGRVQIPLDPRMDLVGNADKYFVRTRKIEKSLKNIQRRLETNEQEVMHLEMLEMALENAREARDLTVLDRELADAGIAVDDETAGREPTRSERKLGPHRFDGNSGSTILAGRTARGNEELTFEIAQAEDLWFHAAGIAGAHVVLKTGGGGPPLREQIEQAASVAAWFSKARGSKTVEVAYTQRKNVRKIPGAPAGTVRLSQYQSMRVEPGLPAERELRTRELEQE